MCAQEKVASATSQAAWAANQALVVKNLEGQLAALQIVTESLRHKVKYEEPGGLCSTQVRWR